MSKNLQLQVLFNAIDKVTAPLKAITDSSKGLGKQLKQTRDQLKGLQSQQSNIQSFKALKAASEQSKQAMSEQQQKVKELAAGMRQAEVPTKAMTKEFQAATREAHRLKQNHSANSQQLQAMRGKLSEAGISTRNLSEAERGLRGRISETNQSLTDQQNRLKRVTDQQKRLSAAKAQYEKTTQLASSMSTAGAGAIAAGGGVLYGLKNLMQTGIEFDKGMSNVQAVARLSSDDPELKMLREQSKRLGAETSFTANQAAEGQGFLAVAGFSPEDILKSMPGVLDLAKAGSVELSAAADIASGALLAMGLESSEMTRVGDVLASTFTSTKTSLESIGETMKVAAPILSSLGVDIETVAAMTGVLGDSMILGSNAGTGMSMIFTRLADPVKATSAALEKIGVSATDAAGKMRHPSKILEDIHRKTKDLTESERIGILAAISGQNALKSMIPLVNAAGSGALREAIQERKEAAGLNAKTAKVASDNLSGDLEGLASAFDGIKLTVFEDQNSALRELTASVTEVLRSVNAWAAENPELVATLVKGVAVIAALVAAGGALMLTVGSILGPLAMMKYGLTVLGIKGGLLIPVIKGIGGALMVVGKAMLANPIFIAIGLLAVAAYMIYKNWAPIKEFFISLWGGISNYLMGVWNQIKAAFSGGIGGIFALLVNWSPLGLFYKAMAGVLGYFGVELPGTFSEFGSGLVNSFTAGLSTAWSSITEFFMARFEDIKTALGGGIGGISALIVNWSPLGLFYQVFAGVMSYFGVDLPSKFSEFGGMIMQGLINGIKNMAGGVKDAVVGMGDSVGGWFKDKLGIKSPSRVFMQFGDDTAEGLALGIAANKDSPLKQVAEMAKSVTAAGALTLASSMSFASDIQFDTRPPIASPVATMQGAAAQAAQNSMAAGNTIHYHINVSGGGDPKSLADEVLRQIEAYDRQKQVRKRSTFGDLD